MQRSRRAKCVAPLRASRAKSHLRIRENPSILTVKSGPRFAYHDGATAGCPARPPWANPKFTEQLMFNLPSDLPAHSDCRWAGRASTPKSWLAAAARTLSRCPAAAVAPAPRDAEREAEAVRALAFTYRVTDRGFADELYAAAERHERANATTGAAPDSARH